VISFAKVLANKLFSLYMRHSSASMSNILMINLRHPNSRSLTHDFFAIESRESKKIKLII